MSKKFTVGDWVEVRSKEEILRTLDKQGELDGMPFMPEMFQFCGQRFQVYKRAHKTCDYTTPYPCHTRTLEKSIHLETRCDGEAHGGCQAGCLIIWKEDWVKPVSEPLGTDRLVTIAAGTTAVPSGKGCTEADVRSNTQDKDLTRYRCQATQTPHATRELKWWDLRQYVEDYTSGNVGLKRIFTVFSYWFFYALSQAGIGLGRPIRWAYDKLQSFSAGSVWPRTSGNIPPGAPTPSAQLNLQPGELVRIKTHREILQTVTTENKNRGMSWDAELVPYCGQTHRVLRRVNRLIDERSGKMLQMKSACIVLDNVICQARYSDHRVLCPKGMYPYWREIWLERTETPPCSHSGEQDREPEPVEISGGVR
jgi:hypothetical protein